MPIIAITYIGLVVVLSLATFFAYGFDKRRARRDGRRVPEKTLHLLALLGGWPGALAGQQVFRHKTHKLGFQLMFWLCVVVHVGAVGGGTYLWLSRG